MTDQCQATTNAGTPCQNPATQGNYCHLNTHQPPDTCGHPTTKGTPCQNPPGPNGHCHLPNHAPDQDNATHPNSLMNEYRLEAILNQANRAPFRGPCADAAGITTRTLDKWMARGRDDLEDGKEDTLYARLVRGFTERKSRIGGNLLGRLTQNGLEGDGRSARFVVSRLYPNELTDELRVDHHVEVAQESRERLRALFPYEDEGAEGASA